MAAVKRVYARGGVVGGGSAGLAIQGAVVYDSVAGDRLNQRRHHRRRRTRPARTAHQLHDRSLCVARARRYDHRHALRRARPLRPRGRLPRADLNDRLLPVRTRSTRSASTKAVPSSSIRTAPQRCSMRRDAHGAYLVRATTSPQLVAGKPLRYTVEVSHIARSGERFDLLHKETSRSVVRRHGRRIARAGLQPRSLHSMTKSTPIATICSKRQLRALLAGEADFIANAANVGGLRLSRASRRELGRLLSRRAAGELVLGPFCGRPACTRFAQGRGVCGAAARSARRSSSTTSTHLPITSSATLHRVRRSSCLSFSAMILRRRLRLRQPVTRTLHRRRPRRPRTARARVYRISAAPPEESERSQHPR